MVFPRSSAPSSADEVDLKIDAGEVLGLMGDNGAVNPTLIKIMAGNFLLRAARSGERRESRVPNPVDARKKASKSSTRTWRCATTHRRGERLPRRGGASRIGPFNFIHYAAMFREAARHLRRAEIGNAPHGIRKTNVRRQRQAVAIARTRLSDPDIVLMMSRRGNQRTPGRRGAGT